MIDDLNNPVTVSGPNGNGVPLAIVGEAAVVPELEKYLGHLDLPLAAKIELLAALRLIMQSFVDRAFGDDPVQHVLGAGGNSTENDAAGARAVIGSSQLPRQPYDLADSFRLNAGKRRTRKIRP